MCAKEFIPQWKMFLSLELHLPTHQTIKLTIRVYCDMHYSLVCTINSHFSINPMFSQIFSVKEKENILLHSRHHYSTAPPSIRPTKCNELNVQVCSNQWQQVTIQPAMCCHCRLQTSLKQPILLMLYVRASQSTTPNAIAQTLSQLCSKIYKSHIAYIRIIHIYISDEAFNGFSDVRFLLFMLDIHYLVSLAARPPNSVQ